MANQGLIQGSLMLVEQIGSQSLQILDLSSQLKAAEAKASDLALKLGEAEGRIKELTVCEEPKSEESLIEKENLMTKEQLEDSGSKIVLAPSNNLEK